MTKTHNLEHHPWVGASFAPDRRICVVGYSHYTERDEPDRASLTNDVVKKVMAKDFGDSSFWRSITTYFGNGSSPEDVCTFWNSVLFFNFLPQAVGTAMFATGKKDQIESAQARFLSILQEHKPKNVLVFSKKAWEALPEMDQEGNGGELNETAMCDQWGTYTFNGSRIIAVGLRHPLFASADDMKERVTAALAVRTSQIRSTNFGHSRKSGNLADSS